MILIYEVVKFAGNKIFNFGKPSIRMSRLSLSVQGKKTEILASLVTHMETNEEFRKLMNAVHLSHKNVKTMQNGTAEEKEKLAKRLMKILT